MAIKVLGGAESTTVDISANVCIVGGGIAGLLAATRLARDRGTTVVVLESGLKDAGNGPNGLNQIEDLSGVYGGALYCRTRQLGGTSSMWDGKLLPLSPHDAQARLHVGMEAWPFDIAELDVYRRDIEALMGIDAESYEADVSERLDRESLLPTGDPDFVVRWPKRPLRSNHQIAHVLRSDIEAMGNLDIWLGATVAEFEFDYDSPGAATRVRTLVAANAEGRRLRVTADEFLLAAGTLESTRLLLWADRQSGHALSRGSDVFGRYFNDHLGIVAADLLPLDHLQTNLALSDRSTFDAGRHLHFELRPDIQATQAVGSAYFDFGAEVPESSGLSQARELVKGLRSRPMHVDGQRLVGVLRDWPSLFWTVQWKLMRKQKYWPEQTRLGLKIWIEQLPQWGNRLELSEQVDAMNIPLLKLTWQKSDIEEKTFRIMKDKIDRFWRQHLSPICRLEWRPEVLAPTSSWVDLAVDQAHPAGSTRMGRDPSTSVVDAQLKVHHASNLSIASASVFPTSGSANPTFTIMQIAMRAADAIATRLQSRHEQIRATAS
jgi:choline dehydrogenase-like flavoprotein